MVYIVPSGQKEYKDAYIPNPFFRLYANGRNTSNGFLLTNKVDSCEEILAEEPYQFIVGYYLTYSIRDILQCGETFWYLVHGFQVGYWLQEPQLSHEKVSPLGYRFIIDDDEWCQNLQENEHSMCLPEELWHGLNDTVTTTILEQPIEIAINEVTAQMVDFEGEYGSSSYQVATTRIGFKNVGNSPIKFSTTVLFDMKNEWGLLLKDSPKSSRLFNISEGEVSLAGGETKEIIFHWKPLMSSTSYNMVYLTVNARMNEEGYAKVSNGSYFFRLPIAFQ